MPNRTSPRHDSFDYRTSAAYFVTVCTHNRRHLFGEVIRDRMRLNPLGRIVADEWTQSELIRDEVLLDASIVMPNHLHGIVCLVPPDVDAVSPRGYDLRAGSNPRSAENAYTDNVGTTGRSSLHSRGQVRPKGPPSRSLSSVLAGFKSAATKRINQHRGTPGAPVWQSRYHDRILRNEREWRACRRYVEQNPARWHQDRRHSARPSK